MPSQSQYLGSQAAYDVWDWVADITYWLKRIGDIKTKAISYVADALAGIVPWKRNDRVFHFAWRVADTLSEFALPFASRWWVTTVWNATSAVMNAISGDRSDAKTRWIGALKSFVSPVVDLVKWFKEQLWQNKKLSESEQFWWGMNR
jgi:hypothetical protein